MDASEQIASRTPPERQRAIAGLAAIFSAALILLCGVATAHAAPIESGPANGVPVSAFPPGIAELKGLQLAFVGEGVFAPSWSVAGEAQAAWQAVQTAATPVVSLPAPAALWLFGSGLCALGLARRRILPWRRHKPRRDEAAGRAPVRAPKRHWRLALRERMREAAAHCGGGASHQRSGIPPGASDGHRAGGPLPPVSVTGLMRRRFEELAAALAEQPNVAAGRGFGYPCIKHGKRPFLVLDQQVCGIAFRVGEKSAAALLAELPLVEYWNPRQERQAKRSWLVCRVSNGEVLVHLAAAAYEYALGDLEPLLGVGSARTAEFARA